MASEMGSPQSLNLDQLLAEGKRLLDLGEKAAALEQIIVANDIAPENETAWLLRAKATDEPQAAIESLEHALSINPENAQAREDLIYLRMHGMQQGVRGLTNIGKMGDPGKGIGGFARRVAASPLARVGLLVLFFASCVLLCLAAYLVNNSLGNSRIQAIADGKSVLTPFILPPTWTTSPTRTSTRTPLPSPTPSGKAKTNLVVRAGPGTSFPRIGTVPQDSIVAIFGRSQDSKYIEISSPELDKPGWVLTETLDLSGADLKTFAVTTPLPITLAPTRPVVVSAPAPKPSDTPLPPSPWAYNVNPRGCQHSGGTFIEGVVRNSYGEEANARVMLGNSPGANIIQTLVTGSERSPGYYTFILNRDGLSLGTFYVWLADANGRILSDPNAARVIIDSYACWQAFIDFMRR